MNKRKVAIVLHGLGANGIDTLFANLSKKWDYEKYEITYLLAVDEDAEQFWEEEVKQNGVKVVHLHDLDKGRLKKWPATLYRALKEYGPFDAIHVNMDMLNGINLMVAKYAGIPVRVCHAHRASSENAGSKVKQAYVAFMRKMMRHYATQCIACSDTAGAYFFPNTQFTTIFNGIDIEKYRQNAVTRGGGSNTFVTVGRFSPPQKPPVSSGSILGEFQETSRCPAQVGWERSVARGCKKESGGVRDNRKNRFYGNPQRCG